MAAAGLVLNGDFDSAMQFCKDECIPKAHGELLGLFRLTEYVSGCLELHLLPRYKEIPVGHLQVAVTRILPQFHSERIMQFSSKDDLKQVLLASCAAYPLASFIRRNSCLYMDGTFFCDITFIILD